MGDQPNVYGLQRGDVVFYRTGTKTFHDLSSDRFDEFAVLAAFGQALPYVLQSDGNPYSPRHEDFKPWVHVSICVDVDEAGEPLVVGFNSDVSDVGNGDANVAPLVVPEGQTLDVLRPPEEFADAVAREAEQFKDRSYSSTGLAAFALATHARIVADPADRDAAMRRAYRAQVIARETDPLGETCVTAAAIAIAAALEEDLCMPEPDPPEQARHDAAFAWADSPAHAMYRKLSSRVWLAGAGVTIAQRGIDFDSLQRYTQLQHLLARIEPSAEQLRNLIDPGARVPIDVPEDFFEERMDFNEDWWWNPGTTTIAVSKLASMIGDALVAIKPGDVDEAEVDTLVDKGCAGADALVASPAMLWDALVQNHGFDVLGSQPVTGTFDAVDSQISEL